jgi:hypothetical protein
MAREEELEDIVAVVGQTFLGLTVNCARCHNHKFDPIPQLEYYRIKAVFEGVKHGERPLGDPVEMQKTEARIAVLMKELKEAQSPASKAELEAIRATLPPMAYVGTRIEPLPTRRFNRGDVTSPEEVVTPGALAVVHDVNADFGLASEAPEAQRRLKFADWLTDKRNPLTARVMVNRVWQHHFGQGLVATPNDFGASGARPSHPELLDWLATKFIQSGWSVKALHRIILQSRTYRQSSLMNAKAASSDAENQWLWRFAPRRLEAEAVRDAMLAVSGRLNPAVGGKSYQPFTITEFNAAFYHLFDRDEPEFNRRTVYRVNVNSGKDPLLDSFDCPDPSVKTPRRGCANGVSPRPWAPSDGGRIPSCPHHHERTRPFQPLLGAAELHGICLYSIGWIPRSSSRLRRATASWAGNDTQMLE